MTTKYDLLGFPCDEGVRRNNGRLGAAQGPKAFRQHWQATKNCEDLGDINCEGLSLEEAQKKLGTCVYETLSSGHRSIVIGGGHETAWGHFQGISKHLGDKNCGVINFDAHFDLRPLIDNKLGSSGTPFLQIAHERQSKNLSFDYLVLGIQPTANSEFLFETASKLNANFILAEKLKTEAQTQIQAILERHEHIYLSICLDVFSKSIAPGVSAPQINGLSLEQVRPLLDQIKASKKVIALDIAELAPPYDLDDKTLKLALELVCYWLKN